MRAKPQAEGHVGVILDGLAAHIDKVLDTHDDFGRETRWVATDDSPLQYERGRLRRQVGPGWKPWDGKEAGQAGEIATLFGQMAAQHLDAIRVLLASREVMFSLAPLTRSILEISRRVYWLLDTEVHNSPRDRAARVFLSQLDDATRRKTAAKPVDHPNIEAFVKEVKRLRGGHLHERFYESEIEVDDGVITLRKQRVPGLGASLRYIEKVTGVDWNTSGMYSYLSNASHPTFHVVLDAYVYDDATGKGHFVAKDARLPYLMTRAAIMSFLRTWQITAKYYGFDDSTAGDLGEQIADLPAPIGDESPRGAGLPTGHAPDLGRPGG